jgi:hypothetical protein
VTPAAKREAVGHLRSAFDSVQNFSHFRFG